MFKKIIVGLFCFSIAFSATKQIDFLRAGMVDGSTGVPLSGGKVATKLAGTSTDKTCWTESDKSIAAANPFILDSNGMGTLYCDGLYKFIVTKSDDSAFFTIDNYDARNAYDPGSDGLVDLGSTSTQFRSLYIDQDIIGATDKYVFDGSVASFTLKGSAVFNEDGESDKDFRVEGDTDANLIFADASADKVGIGTASPAVALDVAGDITLTGTLTGVTINVTGPITGTTLNITGSGAFSNGISAGGNETLLMDVFSGSANFSVGAAVSVAHGKGSKIRGCSNPYLSNATIGSEDLVAWVDDTNIHMVALTVGTTANYHVVVWYAP